MKTFGISVLGGTAGYRRRPVRRHGPGQRVVIEHPRQVDGSRHDRVFRDRAAHGRDRIRRHACFPPREIKTMIRGKLWLVLALTMAASWTLAGVSSCRIP